MFSLYGIATCYPQSPQSEFVLCGTKKKEATVLIVNAQSEMVGMQE